MPRVQRWGNEPELEDEPVEEGVVRGQDAMRAQNVVVGAQQPAEPKLRGAVGGGMALRHLEDLRQDLGTWE